MKGTEIGTRAGCALCHLLSPRVHTMMDMPFPRMSRPEQRMPPLRAQCQERKEIVETEDRGLGAWRCEVFVWTCRALGQAVCMSYKHTQRASHTPEAKFGPGERTSYQPLLR